MPGNLLEDDNHSRQSNHHLSSDKTHQLFPLTSRCISAFSYHVNPSTRSSESVTSRTYPVRRKIRLPRIEYRQGLTFFITIGTHQRYAWFREHPVLCEQSIELLKNLSQARGSILYAWCVLPDHIHVLLEDDDLIAFIRLFKGRMTPLARGKEPRRKLWQRSFFDHALRQEESIYRVALYIWENPVRAGIVEEPHEYPWSGSEVWPDFRNWYGFGRG
jgi:REP element-mobilizing transposase RayT